jgi:hypothetical protein
VNDVIEVQQDAEIQYFFSYLEKIKEAYEIPLLSVCLYVPPNFLVFCVVRVVSFIYYAILNVSKESRRLVFLRIVCVLHAV